MADFGKVAVLLGGNSAEREVSLKSGHAVLQALQSQGIDAHPFDPAHQPVEHLRQLGFERVFIALHGRGGEDGVIQGALEWLGIPYTGSRVLGSALAMDKGRCKQIWQGIGLPTAGFEVVEQIPTIDSAASLLSKLGGAVMVKPVQEGSSIGMARAETPAELIAAIDSALQYDQQVLVEAWLTGAEYTVAILNQQVLPSIRMQTPNLFYDYEAKYQSDTTEYFCPSGLAPEQEQQIAMLAQRAFEAVAAEGWGRVDLMQNADGEFFLLEVNTVPGMTEKSLVPMAAKAAGLSFAELVVEILKGARV